MNKYILFVYVVFLLLFATFSYFFVDPNLLYLKDIYTDFAFSNRFLTTVFYVSFVLIFFLFYGIFIRLAYLKKLRFKDSIMLLSFTVGILVFSYPAMLSNDIFNYIATSKVLFFYNENPYILMPIEFTGDPLLAFTHAANKIALYGPFWILLTGIPYMLGFGNFIVMLFSFKAFIIVFYLATTILIWKISKNILPVILFSLNPLVVVETLISGHNDIVMIFLALLSFSLLIKKKIFSACLFFILSILIKYSTVFLLPIFLYVLWRIARKEEINWKNIYYSSSLFMLAAFLLSPIREEIYPWYAIWFITFIILVPVKKIFLNISMLFSFTLLFRYIPFMVTGAYNAPIPLIKEIISFSPVIFVFAYYVLKKKI